MSFERNQAVILEQRLNEVPTYIIVIKGPRQVGKSYMVERQVFLKYPKERRKFIATDREAELEIDNVMTTTTRFRAGASATVEWLIEEWKLARAKAKMLPTGEYYILAIDEIQKIPNWSEVVKGLWDADRAENLPLHIILLGSSPWLLQKGLTESLTGRFEAIDMPHWSYTEMQQAFDLSLDEYIYFGGYPGSVSRIHTQKDWRKYIHDAFIETINRDILQMTRIDKPILLKNMFELGCQYSGQIISYTKLVGQLKDAGNTTTLAHYLTLLSQAGLLTGLPKYSGTQHKIRASSPKFNVLNTGLMSALTGYTFEEAKADRSYWGRLVESSVGAHLVNTITDNCEVQYWREGSHEVDFILTNGRKHVAIEIKSGGFRSANRDGLKAFAKQYKNIRSLLVGEGGIPLAIFLSRIADEWFEGVEL